MSAATATRSGSSKVLLSTSADAKGAGKEKGASVSKTVSTFFKTLFTSKPDDASGGEGKNDAGSMSLSSPNAAASSSAKASFRVPSSGEKAAPPSPISNSRPGSISMNADISVAGQSPTSNRLQKLKDEELSVGRSRPSSFSSKSSPQVSNVTVPIDAARAAVRPESPAAGSGPLAKLDAALTASRSPRSSSSKMASPLPQPPKPITTLLSVSKKLPANMARSNWCLKDYAIVEKMYTGYASTVYKAWCKASGETVCLKVRSASHVTHHG